MGVPKSWRMVEIVQQVRLGFSTSFIQNILASWDSVQDYAYIVHDKDNSESAKTHIHLMLRFKTPVPTDAILAKFHDIIQVQQLEKIKGGWKSAMAYLCHWNSPEKHQYESTEVFSNYDWQTDAKDALKGKARRQQIVAKIESGEYKRYNITEYVSTQEWVEHEKAIESAFRYQENKQLKRKDREMVVTYIQGEPGTGKTTFAKKLASQFGDYFISSSGKDFLDGYMGQPSIILDDFRGSQAPLSTVLKLLDNNTASSVESRYKNRSISECKQIYITSVLEPFEMFENVFKESREPFIQFKRRLSCLYRMTKSEIAMFRYVPSLEDYEEIAHFPNGVLDEINQFKTVENKKEYAKRMLGGLTEMFQSVSKAIDEQEEDFDKPVEGQISIESAEGARK